MSYLPAMQPSVGGDRRAGAGRCLCASALRAWGWGSPGCGSEAAHHTGQEAGDGQNEEDDGNVPPCVTPGNRADSARDRSNAWCQGAGANKPVCSAKPCDGSSVSAGGVCGESATARRTRPTRSARPRWPGACAMVARRTRSPGGLRCPPSFRGAESGRWRVSLHGRYPRRRTSAAGIPRIDDGYRAANSLTWPARRDPLLTFHSKNVRRGSGLSLQRMEGTSPSRSRRVAATRRLSTGPSALPSSIPMQSSR